MSRPPERVARTVLFADLAGSTAAYERLGDHAAKEAVDRRLTACRRTVHGVRGEVVKSLGDAILASFPRPDVAALAAERMQQQAASGEDFGLRIGFHHGEVLLDGADVFGDAVNLAARLTEAARSGQVLTSASTVAALPVDWQRRFRSFDRVRLKGKSMLVEIHELLWEAPDAVTRIGTALPRQGQTSDRHNWISLRLGGWQQRLAAAQMPLSLGRDATCDVRLNHELASRRHAEFRYERGKFVYADHSTNGSFVTLGSGREVFLRRESMPLTGSGVISPGCTLHEQTQDALRFSVE